MKNLRIGVMPAVAAIVLASCSNEADNTVNPEPPAEPVENVKSRVEAFVAEDATTSFVYDDEGRISMVEITSSDYDGSSFIRASYTYPADRDEIGLRYTTYTGSPVGENGTLSNYRTWDEVLTIEDGLIAYCEGICDVREPNSTLNAKYRIEYSYDSERRLTTAKHYQWPRKYGDYDMDHPWIWHERFVWEKGNMIRHEDEAGGSSPKYIYNYIYNAWPAVDNIGPLVCGMFDAAHSPLHSAGYFGKASENLVSKINTINDLSVNGIKEFGYLFDDRGRIKSYSETYYSPNRYTSYIWRVDWKELSAS